MAVGSTYYQLHTSRSTVAAIPFNYQIMWSSNLSPEIADLAYMGNNHFAVVDLGDPAGGLTPSTLSVYRRDASVGQILNVQPAIVSLPAAFIGDEYEQFLGVTMNEHCTEFVTLVTNELAAHYIRGYNLNGGLMWSSQDLGIPNPRTLCFDGKHYYTTNLGLKVGNLYQLVVDTRPENTIGGIVPVNIVSTATLPQTNTSYSIEFNGKGFLLTVTSAARTNNNVEIHFIQRASIASSAIATRLFSGVVSVPRGIAFDGCNPCFMLDQ